VILWFRAEEPEIVDWAGNPHKAMTLGPGGALTPRSSFDAWRETVRGRSRRWTAAEVDAAWRLREFIERVRQLDGEISFEGGEPEQLRLITTCLTRAPYRPPPGEDTGGIEPVEALGRQVVRRWRDVVAALESLRAQVNHIEVALAQAETNLTYSYIRAPFSGYVAERNLDLGAYVTGAATSNSTTSRGIVSLHDIETVRTLIEVVEKDVPLVQIGQKAEIRAEAYPDRVFQGTVTRVVQALNRATRTMTVEVDLPNKDRLLKGGMFARVEVLVGKHQNALQIPIDAVSRLEDAQYVYIVRDGKAERVSIEIGVRDENRVEITKGLTGSEQVIVSGKDLVHDGTPVQTEPLTRS
jgi:RND family efflux transporter MFP subunit